MPPLPRIEAPLHNWGGDTIVIVLPDFAARVRSQAQKANSALAYTDGNGAQLTTTVTRNVAPDGISEVIELQISIRGDTALPVFPSGQTFGIVDGDPGGGRGVSMEGTFLRLETMSDVKRDALTSTVLRALVACDGGRGVGEILLALLALGPVPCWG